MTTKNKAPSSIFQVFLEGLRLMIRHRAMLLKLSTVPFIITLITLFAVRLLDNTSSIFWLPVIQLPSSFVIGFECAILIRFFLLGEYPVIKDDAIKALRNTLILQGSVAYASVTYFMTGAYAIVFKMNTIIQQAPELAPAYMPIALFILIGVFFGARYLWLNIPLSLNLNVSTFYKRIGGWGGSLRIFALFGLCSVMLNFIISLFRAVVHIVFGGVNQGFLAAFDDVCLAVATIILAVSFICVSVVASQGMMKETKK
jgi:hypothetical protein